MSLKKLWTALKGGVNEATEAAADSQSIRILDQELREAKNELVACDQNLAKIMAKRKLTEKKVASLNEEVVTYTNHAITASEKGDEALALECAEKVADLEVALATEQEILNGFSQSEKALKENIQKAKTNVRRMEQQIDQIKATASVQKAQVAVSSRHMGANSKVKTALDSLDRIKQKQQEKAAELEAAEEMAAEESGSSLDARLKASGIVPGGQASGKDKLAELLAKKASNT
ncbi:PspA/IM30 family protein [Neptunomonas phycophila]|jgi:phage shock protein A|uniref:PspA/IM30 family protein n=1 Tax=Neptunomonas phycophila TaxID=1572645 RepID=A0AAW7XIC5_9GAMM|nr:MULTISPECIES: PspA/IM30 family protein [Neptunomonas]MBT3145620.1 PspA/IM30 family protein [Neptunomonas phycophila]MDN2660114.1 PspA/IM30 family protein [Neptunomonas sp. CHC150]MDO6453138.1 PspA/IM30 family protein [Neptunomonas phycophila]MDO6469243.1 PspA/IM30 family protein [Neptunomonas phycophila]MDO6784420.1 PspA/IM30 family protein [Neptunomonas phycophila]